MRPPYPLLKEFGGPLLEVAELLNMTTEVYIGIVRPCIHRNSRIKS